MNTLITYLDGIQPLSDSLRWHLMEVIKTSELAKKEYLLRAGQVCRNIYFIRTGLIRHFGVEQEAEVTFCFMKENDIVYSAASYYRQVPSVEFIQAVEPTRLYFMGFTELEDIFARFPEFGHLYRKISSEYHVLSEQRIRLLRMPLTEDRYKYMLEHHHDMVLRVPDKYMASYLGTTDVHLSRIKKWIY